MTIRKAVITAAARGVRLFPVADTVQKAMLPLSDRDGLAKPVIQIIAEEALDSGIEEVCIVCAPGDEDRYRRQLTLLRENVLESYGAVEWARDQAARLERLLQRLSFAVQREALGYGHAVSCARAFAGDEPFLLLLGDHLYVSDETGRRCAQQLLDLATQENCAVAAVNPTREHLVRNYGTVSGRRAPDLPGVYEVERIAEKPSLSLAEMELQTPGLRAGYYLCLFGMHVLSPAVFDVLERRAASREEEDRHGLTPALQQLAERGKYLAAELHGRRYDIGTRFGLLQAQIALGMAGADRDAMLTALVEQLAEAAQAGPAGGDR